jgi:two-component system, NtrC family, response regulator HupR/HoxA
MTKPTRPPLPRQTVLVVDDEQEIRTVMTLGLQEHFEVETAGSAAEAEMMLGTKAYDIVVCDHLMPDEEGLTFLTRAREQFPKTQRILVTGYINPELLSRSAGIAGLAGVLMKPVNTAELIQTIRMAVPR